MKIPRDLKPGDKLWYSKTKYATVKVSISGPYSYTTEGNVLAKLEDDRAVAYNEAGIEVDGDTTKIIRIERVASEAKREKKDNDAAYLLRLASHHPICNIPGRLNGHTA